MIKRENLTELFSNNGVFLVGGVVNSSSNSSSEKQQVETLQRKPKHNNRYKYQ